ncbi:hypothetical protein MBOVPG45_0652 [Mycoplasmopsis bovis PG45]|uniref:Uncharacterized protein n=1 Tax=Mycoplasmopsis bovis (strain ATCC 25523 / DSM 22781 / NCTC 10131 / PG45) TaxID=289397 RepID=A0A454AQS4_MYCBG|nr:hypothetical protein MBOVPG45_0652 [Mycoplasmopsis bovis PG45]
MQELFFIKKDQNYGNKKCQKKTLFHIKTVLLVKGSYRHFKLLY